MNNNENRFTDGEPTNFGLPEGYFQNSAAKLMNRMEWLEEHKGYDRLSSLKGETGFVIPGLYFEKAECRTELMNYPGLSSVKKQKIFSVPDGYFEEAEVKQLSTVLTDEEFVLSSVTKQKEFIIPSGYFEENEVVLKTLLTENKQTKTRVISLFATRRIVMAAAALLLVVTGTWMYRLYSESQEEKDCGTIACIDRMELLKTKTLENLETDELYELVNSKKLEENLHKGTINDKQKTDSSRDRNDEAMDDLMDGI